MIKKKKKKPKNLKVIFYSEQMVEYIVYVCILEWGNSVTETDNCIKVRFKEKKFSSVAQSCWTLCNPMNHSTPGLPVHYQLPEFTQTQVHRVS